MITPLLLIQATLAPPPLDVQVGDAFEEAIVAEWIPLDDDGVHQKISYADSIAVTSANNGTFEAVRKRQVTEWRIDGSAVPVPQNALPIQWQETWRDGALTVVRDENEALAVTRIHRFTSPLLGKAPSGVPGFAVHFGRSGWTLRDEMGASATVTQGYVRTEPGTRNPGYPGRRTVTVERAPMPGGSSQYRLIFSAKLSRFSPKQ